MGHSVLVGLSGWIWASSELLPLGLGWGASILTHSIVVVIEQSELDDVLSILPLR